MRTIAAIFALFLATVQARPAFDVASVKVNNTVKGPPQMRYNPAGVDLSNVPLPGIIGEAYSIPKSRISSPDAQDGKSLVSANLAFSFALDPGRRVVIVDCDLRNPGLDKYLGVPAEPGLLQHLLNGHLSPYC